MVATIFLITCFGGCDPTYTIFSALRLVVLFFAKEQSGSELTKRRLLIIYSSMSQEFNHLGVNGDHKFLNPGVWVYFPKDF